MGSCSSREDFKHATSCLLPHSAAGGPYGGCRGCSGSCQWHPSTCAPDRSPAAAGCCIAAPLFDSDNCSARWKVVAPPATAVTPVSHNNLCLYELAQEGETAAGRIAAASSSSSRVMRRNNEALQTPSLLSNSLLLNKIDFDLMDLQAMSHISYLEATKLRHMDSVRHQEDGSCNVSSPIMERAWSSPISSLTSLKLPLPLVADHHSLTSSSSTSSSCMENLSRNPPPASDVRSKRPRGLVLPARESARKLRSLTTFSFSTQDYYLDGHPTDCSVDQCDNATITTSLSPDCSSPVTLNQEQKEKKTQPQPQPQQQKKVFSSRKFSCAGWSICADTDIVNSTVNPPSFLRSKAAIDSVERLCESCRRSPTTVTSVNAAPSSLLLNRVSSSARWLQSQFKLGAGSAGSTVNNSGNRYVEEFSHTSAASEIYAQPPATVKGKSKRKQAAAAATHISSYNHPRYRKATTPPASLCESPALQKQQSRARRSNAILNSLPSRWDESINAFDDKLEVSQCRRGAKHRAQRQSRRTRFMRASLPYRPKSDGYASLFSSATASPLNMEVALSRSCEFDTRNNPYSGLFSPHPWPSAKSSPVHSGTLGQPVQLAEEVDRLSFRFLDGCSTTAVPIEQINTHTRPRARQHRHNSFTFPNLVLQGDEDDKSVEESLRLHNILSSDSEAGADLEEESMSSDKFDAALAYYKSSDAAEPSFSSSSGTVNEGSTLLHTTSYTTTSDNDYYPSRAQKNSMRKQNFILKQSRGGSRVVSKHRSDRLLEPNTRPSANGRKTRDGASINGFSYPARASMDQRANFPDRSKAQRTTTTTTTTGTKAVSRSSSPSMAKKLQEKADSASAYINNDSGRRSYSRNRGHHEAELPPSKRGLRVERRAEKMTPAREESNRFRR